MEVIVPYKLLLQVGSYCSLCLQTFKKMRRHRKAHCWEGAKRKRNNLVPLAESVLECRVYRLTQQYSSTFAALCSNLLTSLVLCAFCGTICLSKAWSITQYASFTDGDAPPYSICNAVLPDEWFKTKDGSMFNVCSFCQDEERRKKRLQYSVFMNIEYMQELLGTNPLSVQSLSLLDVSTVLHKKLNGFTVGEILPRHILESPLIRFGKSDQFECTQLLQQLLSTHPLVQKFKTSLELHDVVKLSVDSSVVERIIEHHRQRGPLDLMDSNLSRDTLGLLLDCSRVRDENDRHALLPAGNLVARNSNVAQSIRCRTNGLSLSQKMPSVEEAVFPFMFPFGEGAFDGSCRFEDYLAFRCGCLFSPWKLFKPYLLYMYEIKMAHSLLDEAPTVAIEKAVKKYKEKNPEAKDEECMRHVLSHKVGKNIVGMPSWYRTQLHDLKCRAQTWGLPHLFMTLTADEFSETKFPEMEELDRILGFFKVGLKWSDAPVECALLFHLRVKLFLKHYVMQGGENILGRVEHYVLRYEIQQRDSLHAHIMLWVNKDDVETCGDDIVACIPATYDYEKQSFIEPQNLEAQRLMNLVMDKQMHECRGSGCRRDNPDNCKYGFPFEPQYSRRPVLDSSGKRWRYFRPGEEHRNVVPYHPQLLLIWGAHMNLQKVTGNNWSFYVLKYSMKAEPEGTLNLNPINAKCLGLEGLSELQLKLLSAQLFSKPVSASEAACHCLKIPMVQSDTIVNFVPCDPPDTRTVGVYGGRINYMSFIDKYCGRAAMFESYTFKQYFRKFVLKTPTEKQLQKEENKIKMDAFGMVAFDRKGLVRFTAHSPKDTEEFAYSLLLENIHFRSENEIFSPENKQRSYLVEAILRRIIRDEQHWSELVTKYCQDNFYSDSRTSQLVAEMMGRIEDLDIEVVQIDDGIGENLILDSLTNQEDIFSNERSAAVKLSVAEPLEPLLEPRRTTHIIDGELPIKKHKDYCCPDVTGESLTPSQKEVFKNVFNSTGK